MVKLKLYEGIDVLLDGASHRSGRSKSFEASIRLKDHLKRYPVFERESSLQQGYLVKYLTMRLDEETNVLLIAAKNKSGWCKTDEAADRITDHLVKHPDFYNAEIFTEVVSKKNLISKEL
ncbi:TraY domain-containing protein [Salmonella enterica]|nr:TraY domain-containing protein [Salmonella enterica]